MIEVRNLVKIYRTKQGVSVRALDRVSLKLPERGMVFLLGKSGSGKSTLLNVMGGLDTPDSGAIIINGTPCVNFRQSHYDSYRNTYIGFIFQEYNLLEEMTVGANIALAIELQGRRATDEEVNRILAEVDLSGYGARKPNELSGGQKQRVAIARALVKNPEIIMADEPTGALDSATGKQVFELLKRLSEDKLVLIVSHDREFSERYADRIIELADGRVISDVEKTGELHESVVEELIEEELSSPEEENLTFSENEITVKCGYTLTEEDRLLINRYLEGVKEDISIQKGKDTAVKASHGFAPTDEGRISSSERKGFKLIKSKLSLKNAFKIGSGALKYKKFRLAFTIFLSLIAFTLFGLSDTIAAYDSVSVTTKSLIDSGVSYASFMKEYKVKYGDGDNDFYWNGGGYISEDDIKKINDETGIGVIGVFNDRNTPLSLKTNLGIPDEIPPTAVLYSSSLSGLAPIDEAFLESSGFTLTGRLPKDGENEIVLTDFTYEYFKVMGYIPDYFSDTEKIDSKEKLIGKKITLSEDVKNLEIVGILDTGFDYSRFLPLTDENLTASMNPLVLVALMSELESARSYSFACLGFVSEDLIKILTEKNADAPLFLDGYLGTYFESEDGGIQNYTAYEFIQPYSKAKDDIIWLGEAKDSLSEGEIVIPAPMLIEYMTHAESEFIDTLYNDKSLKGFERELYLGGVFENLYEIFLNFRFAASYKYAMENPENAALLLEELYGSAPANKGDCAVLFAETAASNTLFFERAGLSEYEKNYFESVVKTYSLSSITLPEEAVRALVGKCEHGGSEYYSYDESRLQGLRIIPVLQTEIASMAGLKYAAENLDDARHFYELYNKTEDSSNIPDVLQLYSLYVQGFTTLSPDFSFAPTAQISFGEYSARLYAGLYGQISANTSLAIEWESFITGEYGYSEGVKIVGVIKTEGEYKNVMVISDVFANELMGSEEGGIYTFAIGNMPADSSEVERAVRFSKSEHGDFTHRFALRNSVTAELSFIEELLVILGKVFLYVGVAFAVFAALMLSNFIGTSIIYKKQDIGILRAIGSRSADVFRIFFAESFIIAMINFTLSTLSTFILTLFINSVIRNNAGLLITFLSFGIREVLLLLTVSLAVALIATFLPVRKIAAMKPIDAIRHRS